MIIAKSLKDMQCQCKLSWKLYNSNKYLTYRIHKDIYDIDVNQQRFYLSFKGWVVCFINPSTKKNGRLSSK
jgi:hypothetical protein